MIKRIVSTYWFLFVLVVIGLVAVGSNLMGQSGLTLDDLRPQTVSIAHALTADELALGRVVDATNISDGSSPQLPTIDLSLLRYCVAWALDESQVKNGEKVGPANCFGTQEGAADYIATTTGADKPAILLALNGEIVMNTPIIGTDYDSTNYGGSWLYWTVNNADGCYNGRSYYAPNYPSNWDNRVQSARAGSGCGHFPHYDLINYDGAMIDCPACAAMGAMSRATSSAKWWQ